MPSDAGRSESGAALARIKDTAQPSDGKGKRMEHGKGYCDNDPVTPEWLPCGCGRDCTCMHWRYCDLHIKTLCQADLDAAVAKAVEVALSDVVREVNSISTTGAGEYARGFDQAMRLVEGLVKAIRARGGKT